MIKVTARTNKYPHQYTQNRNRPNNDNCFIMFYICMAPFKKHFFISPNRNNELLDMGTLHHEEVSSRKPGNLFGSFKKLINSNQKHGRALLGKALF